LKKKKDPTGFPFGPAGRRKGSGQAPEKDFESRYDIPARKGRKKRGGRGGGRALPLKGGKGNAAVGCRKREGETDAGQEYRDRGAQKKKKRRKTTSKKKGTNSGEGMGKKKRLRDTGEPFHGAKRKLVYGSEGQKGEWSRSTRRFGKKRKPWPTVCKRGEKRGQESRDFAFRKKKGSAPLKKVLPRKEGEKRHNRDIKLRRNRGKLALGEPERASLGKGPDCQRPQTSTGLRGGAGLSVKVIKGKKEASEKRRTSPSGGRRPRGAQSITKFAKKASKARKTAAGKGVEKGRLSAENLVYARGGKATQKERKPRKRRKSAIEKGILTRIGKKGWDVGAGEKNTAKKKEIQARRMLSGRKKPTDWPGKLKRRPKKRKEIGLIWGGKKKPWRKTSPRGKRGGSLLVRWTREKKRSDPPFLRRKRRGDQRACVGHAEGKHTKGEEKKSPNTHTHQVRKKVWRVPAPESCRAPSVKGT